MSALDKENGDAKWPVRWLGRLQHVFYLAVRMESAHYGHYVRREVVQWQDGSVACDRVEAPWFSGDQPNGQGFKKPVYHITRSATGPAARIKQGDTLWIFSQLFTPWGNFPPALDAKIIIKSVLDNRSASDRKFAFRYTANQEKSHWFLLFDARPCLWKLRTVRSIGSGNREHSLLARKDQPLGRALQSIRQISNPKKIIELEEKLTGLPFDFVSYRLKDGTRSACLASLLLVGKGKAIFWDRWSLPRRVAERRERVSDPILDEFIKGRISMSVNVWAISSPAYAEEDSYSLAEKIEAERQGKLRFWKASVDSR